MLLISGNIIKIILGVIMVKFPCKGCTERHISCWGSCEKYLSAKEEQEHVKNASQQECEKNAYFYGKKPRPYFN